MKKNEIKVGGVYAAKISGRIVPVKVLAIRDTESFRYGHTSYCGGSQRTTVTVYDVENQVTGRRTTFRSAAKFRYEIKPGMTQAEERKVCSDILDKAEMHQAGTTLPGAMMPLG